ncbi:MAG: hypothetical protein KC502_10625 [Myxococcales bacterium]|nr:hypothetical protein [Myxococcales bacterium]
MVVGRNRQGSRLMPTHKIAIVMIALTCVLAAAEAQAAWRGIRDVSRGTAHVLEKGEITFGVFAPIAYGVTDALMVQSSPVFDLLLYPNVDARYRLMRRGNFVLSATLHYKQAFLGEDKPGELDFGGVGTVYIGSRFAITGGLLIAQRFSTRQNDNFQGGLAAQLAAHMLINRNNLLMVTAYLRTAGAASQDAILAADRPLVSVAWIKQLKVIFNMHLVLGMSYGRFELTHSPTNVTTLPVWPTIDAWWRY